MRLSVVMAVRDGERYLRDAVESVLAQTITDFEFLIVDDGSTDATGSILAEYAHRDSRIRVLRHARPQGPYPSANLALQQARGDAIARHDADDISPPDRFAIQYEALRSSPDVSLVTGAVHFFGPASKGVSTNRPPAWQPRFEWEMLFRNAVAAGAHVMFPRVVGGEPVRFPARYPYAEDYGLWLWLSRRGRVVCPSDTIYLYRRHHASISSQKPAQQRECLSLIRHDVHSQYLPAGSTREISDTLSRFWNVDTSVPLAGGVETIHATLGQLRAAFLAYVGDRNGAADRDLLAQQIEAEHDERLAYWVYRSLTRLDFTAAADLLKIARSRRRALTVSIDTGRHTVEASLRKLGLRPSR